MKKTRIQSFIYTAILWAVCFTIAVDADAKTVVSAHSGYWGSNSTWVGGSVPSTNDNIIISSGDDVVLNGNLTQVGMITISSGATLEDGGYKISVKNNLNPGMIVKGTLYIQSANGLTKSGSGNNPTVQVYNGGLVKFGTSGSTGIAKWDLNDGSTIEYSGGGQTLDNSINVPYSNLSLSGYGTKSLGSDITVNGVLSLGGTANVSLASNSLNYGNNATLLYKTTNSRTTGSEWVSPFNSSGGVIIANTSGTLTISENKTLGASAALTINSGANISLGSYVLTLSGDFVNNGSISTGSGGVVITGTADQSISGFSTTGDLNITKTSGTATISGNCSAANLTVNAPGSTIILNGSNTFSGIRTLSAGTMVLGNNAALGSAGSNLVINGGTLQLATNNSINACNISLGGDATIIADRSTPGAGITYALGDLSIGANTLNISGGNNITSGTAGISFNNVSHSGAPTYIVNNPSGGGVTQLSLGAVSNSFYLTTFAGNGNIVQTDGFSSGWGGITYNGTGKLILSQANNYKGKTTINSGTLNVQHSNALGSSYNGTIINSGATLEIQGGININNESLDLAGNGADGSSGALRNISGNNTIGGAIDINGAVTRISSDAGSLTLSNNLGLQGNTLYLQGNSTDNNMVSGIISSSTDYGAVYKLGSGNWTLSASNTFKGGVQLQNGTLNLNNSSALGNTAGTFTIGGFGNPVSLDNTSGSSIVMQDYPINWNGNFSFTGSNALNLGSGTISMGANRQVTVNASTLTAGGTLSAASYNLTKAGSGNLSFGSNPVTLNGLTISAGTFSSTSGTLSLSGNFSNNGSFAHNNGSVSFVGTANQNVGGSSTSTFYNMTLNNTDKITLGNTESVQNTLTMTKGNIYTGSNRIAIGTSTSNKGTLAYSSGYVVGNMRRYFNGTNSGNASGLFPLGQDVQGSVKNRNYLIEFSTAPTTGGYLDVYFQNDKMGFSGLPISNVNSVANGSCPTGGTFNVMYTADQGYWVANPQSSTLGVDGNYTLSLTGQDLVTINDLCQLALLKRVNGGPWAAPGVQNATTGTTSMPTVSSSALSGFSNFGFGGGGSNPLPVELVQFRGNCQEGTVNLEWATASEINNDHFILERSYDAVNWSSLQTIKGAGNSNQLLHYQATDQPEATTAYYRLQQHDFSGKMENSPIVEVSCSTLAAAAAEASIYPNVSSGIFYLHNAPEGATYEVLDVSGNTIRKVDIDNAEQLIDLQDQNEGMYILALRNGGKISTYKIMIHH